MKCSNITIPGLDLINECNPMMVAELVARQDMFVQYIASLGKFRWNDETKRFIFNVKRASIVNSTASDIISICREDEEFTIRVKVEHDIDYTESDENARVTYDEMCTKHMFTIKYNLNSAILGLYVDNKSSLADTLRKTKDAMTDAMTMGHDCADNSAENVND